MTQAPTAIAPRSLGAAYAGTQDFPSSVRSEVIDDDNVARTLSA